MSFTFNGENFCLIFDFSWLPVLFYKRGPYCLFLNIYQFLFFPLILGHLLTSFVFSIKCYMFDFNNLLILQGKVIVSTYLILVLICHNNSLIVVKFLYTRE